MFYVVVLLSFFLVFSCVFIVGFTTKDCLCLYNNEKKSVNMDPHASDFRETAAMLLSATDLKTASYQTVSPALFV